VGTPVALEVLATAQKQRRAAAAGGGPGPSGLRTPGAALLAACTPLAGGPPGSAAKTPAPAPSTLRGESERTRSGGRCLPATCPAGTPAGPPRRCPC
jgi:hypothetical protein